MVPLLVAVFFFQAEDGIRDRNVTGVQTCALPISLSVNVATLVATLTPVATLYPSLAGGTAPATAQSPCGEPQPYDGWIRVASASVMPFCASQRPTSGSSLSSGTRA